MRVLNTIKEMSCFDDLFESEGSGILNTALRKLPIPELHMSLPKYVASENVDNGSFNNTGRYSFCGPGTKLEKRLEEGYKGVNDLDKACKEHDIAYSKEKSTEARNKADDALAHIASAIAIDPKVSKYEKNDAKTVMAIMATKSRLGMGVSKKKMKKN